MEFEETISGSHISCKTLSQYMMVLRGFRLSAHCVLKDPTIEMLNIRKIPERMEIQVRWRLKSEACALRTMLSMGPDCDAVLDANSVFRVSEDGYVCFHRCEKVQRRFDPEDDAPNILQRMGRKLSGRGATPCPAYSKHDG
ncbi:hypothetical protein SARC_08638 [Sphaeroforma arctica JP610]|uniref:Uncharacterized protein n=1 Tax=Sphaeroforma arctica JP610 TaxID=667725 RepID=A0A0L0FSJ8_9EUKA|nr:hypothetical protein SARC_08638 [Sphaeroforma arctica JP610]KNC78948.1 hypothetical protein SARC_08638 [Sphaeroforma arctica JP610]|eukprot:XP_014152850.1 hypothetical protein SARC_08638 [Sphaeroforma arctica JP610]